MNREPLKDSLLQSLRDGDPAAFETLVREHGGPMLVVARRLVGNEEDARDVLQEAFVLAFRGMGSFLGESSIATWLHRIVINAGLMKLRRRKQRPERLIDDLLPKFLDDGHQAEPAVDWRLTADEALLQQEIRQQVRACIDELPEIYRTVLVLRDMEELDAEETARLLGVTTGVVKTRLHRARQALRGLLDPLFRGAR